MEKAFQYSVRLLTLKNYTRRQLAAKLNQKGFEPETIEATIEKLQHLNYIHEDEAKRSFIKRNLSKGLSSSLIQRKAKYSHLDLTAEEISNIQAEGKSPETIVHELIQKKIKLPLPEDRDERSKLKQRIFRHLMSKGHSTDLVLSALKDYF
jgi:regulatory protein